MRSGLQVQLFREFNLFYAGVPLTTINTPRLQSLLAYCILHRNAPQSRPHLAFLLWPDSSESQARTNLRNLIYLLRQALPEPDTYLCVNGLMLQWQPEAPFTLDVADFERAIAQGNLEEAIALYQGELLPGCYDDWLVPERERLQQMFLETLERLLRQTEKRGDYHAALGHAHHLLRQDPLREDTYRHLMRLYALSGDRIGVVRTYDTCANVLRRELSIEPTPETHQAYERSLRMPATVSQTVRHPDHSSNNLPFQLTTFIGREGEKLEVEQLITTHRLVTLLGAGGVGKTRLALAVAGEILDTFAAGTWHVDLAPLSGPAPLEPAVAAAVGMREEGGLPLLVQLADYLRPKHMLLILDNCEHQVEGVRQMVQTILEGAPNLRILATSRVVLGVEGEATWRVPPLAVPDMALWTDMLKQRMEDLSLESDLALAFLQYESVQFFADRAATVLPTFVVTNQNVLAVGQICQRLDGIPLALELAAARVNLLTVQQIAARLDNALLLLAHSNPTTVLPHHQTLRATMEWSYTLLSAKEQVLFHRLSVFVGSFTLEAVEFIGSGSDLDPDQTLDVLSGLVDKSLVAVEAWGEATRFRLHESTRQYAWVRLREAGEVEATRNRHLDYFCGLAETTEPDLLNRRQAYAVNRLVKEYDNLRAALTWSTTKPGDPQRGLRLAVALSRFWELRGFLVEERAWLEKLLASVDGSIPPVVHARALRAAGMAAFFQNEFTVVRSYLEQSLALDRESGNKAGVARTLTSLGLTVSAQEEWATAGLFFGESLALYRVLGDLSSTACALSELGYVVFRQDGRALGRSLIEEGLELFRELGEKLGIARCHYLLGHLARFERDFARARACYSAAVTAFRQIDSLWGDFYVLAAFGNLAVAEGQFERAARLFGAMAYLGDNLGTSLVPTERVEHDRDMAAARTALGELSFRAAWISGRVMSLNEALAYAQEEPQ